VTKYVHEKKGDKCGIKGRSMRLTPVVRRRAFRRYASLNFNNGTLIHAHVAPLRDADGAAGWRGHDAVRARV